MNIRLFRSCSVPIWISSPELHVEDTCFLHEVNNIERYVTTTYRLHELKCNEQYYEFISMYMYSLRICRVSVFGRRSWNILCRGKHLSAGFTDMLRQRP